MLYVVEPCDTDIALEVSLGKTYQVLRGSVTLQSIYEGQQSGPLSESIQCGASNGPFHVPMHSACLLSAGAG